MNVRWSKLIIVCCLCASTCAAESVELTVLTVDQANGQAMPARVHLADANKKPIRPPGLPFWRDHFSSAGQAEILVEPGRYSVTIERGPEWSAASSPVDIPAGVTRTNLTFALRRLVNLASEGWWSGETHVHRSVADAELLLRSEDLHIAQVITWWNKVNPWSNQPLPAVLPARVDGNRFFHSLAGEDERDGGALLLFNLGAPLDIVAGEKHFPSSLKYARLARERGAWIDIEKPFWWDTPMWIANGVGDSVGLANNHMYRDGVYENEAWGKPRDRARHPGVLGNGNWTQEIYYHLLNCGIRIPPSAGSASGVLPNPVGYNRAYVHLDGELTWEKWWAGLRAGRVFVSNGPLLRCQANGEWPGTILRSTAPLTIKLDGLVDSREPVRVVELVRPGVVEKITLPTTFTLKESGWFLVRALGTATNTFRFASTAPWYVEIGGQPMKPRRESAQFFVDWCRERIANLEKLTNLTPTQRAEVLEPWRSAAEFWSKKLVEVR
ncbi:MAG: hypothetical protein EXS31_08530 [Pedosphaera sp.]|nr:hypothetical protein [Pedosphaera sp.]